MPSGEALQLTGAKEPLPAVLDKAYNSSTNKQTCLPAPRKTLLEQREDRHSPTARLGPVNPRLGRDAPDVAEANASGTQRGHWKLRTANLGTCPNAWHALQIS
ncbi:hypothetical protein EYF80_032654 [Liparis tanakae]|uniref:Uncharacterized protein n=1 Tax=Liparis tanakae TaxID=230148 RepID=A0A4Z2GUW2_9TELE|nr:hypothetical protein EYF80_032654 [Liparis tanakae]